MDTDFCALICTEAKPCGGVVRVFKNAVKCFSKLPGLQLDFLKVAIDAQHFQR